VCWFVTAGVRRYYVQHLVMHKDLSVNIHSLISTHFRGKIAYLCDKSEMYTSHFSRRTNKSSVSAGTAAQLVSIAAGLGH
jgi:hypothetical protein